jgi:hypothetical protein
MWMTMYEVIHIFIYSNNIFNIEYYQDNIASWQFIQHVIAENKGGKVLKKVITLIQSSKVL